jgi:hypothetical protein
MSGMRTCLISYRLITLRTLAVFVVLQNHSLALALRAVPGCRGLSQVNDRVKISLTITAFGVKIVLVTTAFIEKATNSGAGVLILFRHLSLWHYGCHA